MNPFLRFRYAAGSARYHDYFNLRNSCHNPKMNIRKMTILASKSSAVVNHSKMRRSLVGVIPILPLLNYSTHYKEHIESVKRFPTLHFMTRKRKVDQGAVKVKLTLPLKINDLTFDNADR
jgi:hypothetical protein